ncbi:uncharacterized protein BcabD6B2_26710 [Babesia caballi]|uniref:Uncharacterized protein n=1 Tax=Babesia caballi TaxID=5871 RepID=A0AAV4LVV6_BABCB|nr:hypothetical protein, conserved [Babesia caballi]
MGSMAFADGILNTGKNGTAVVGAAFSKFTEFKEATQPSDGSFATFTKELGEKVSSQSGYTGYPLSVLFYGASCYFRCQQIKHAKLEPKSPSTIREMLYFLAPLPYASVYDELENHITTSLSTPLPVSVSGSATKNETMSSSDLLGILVTSCLSCPWVIGTIEGRGTSEPLLHDLYCNKMGFTYPSGPTLLNIIAEYVYALQFQRHFLYQQCSNVANTCGWRECQFGKAIIPNGSMNSTDSLKSHICSGLKCTTSNCQHNGTSGQCNHNNGGIGANCGKQPMKPSPLQAFLTDRLKGFSRGHPSDPSSHLATCSGHTCHVPMGFESHLRAGNNYQGSLISLTLRPLCGGFNTPLRQLFEKLGCLSKRTPRTLGDLFGFLWHLNDQMFKTRPKMETLAKNLVKAIGQNNHPSKVPSFIINILEGLARPHPPPHPSPGPSPTGLSRSLETMAPAIPFLY